MDGKDIWYLDSGCNNHIKGNTNNFVKLIEGRNSQVNLGDEKLQMVEGKRVLAVQTRRGKTKYICDTLYVSGLTKIYQVWEN